MADERSSTKRLGTKSGEGLFSISQDGKVEVDIPIARIRKRLNSRQL